MMRNKETTDSILVDLTSNLMYTAVECPIAALVMNQGYVTARVSRGGTVLHSRGRVTDSTIINSVTVFDLTAFIQFIDIQSQQ